MEQEKKPSFKGYSDLDSVSKYHRNLPHWQQEGCTYFITFRLADSIPRSVILKWQDDDAIWLRANGITGPLPKTEWQKVFNQLPADKRIRYEQRKAHRLHLELDRSQGSCLLQHIETRVVLSKTLHFYNGKRWWIGDYVIMPNHVHCLIQPMRDYQLQDILRSIKGYSSKKLTMQGAKSGRLWQQESFDRLIRNREELNVFRCYISKNPHSAKLQDCEYTYYRCDWLDPPLQR